LTVKLRLTYLLLFLLFTTFSFLGCGAEVAYDEPGVPLGDVAAKEPGSVSVHFLDVGQGDCTLIISDSEVMLIDAGEQREAAKIIRYLEEQGVTSIDYLIATHPHSDHIGGLADIINRFEIGEIFMPRVLHTTRTFENLLDTLLENDLTVSNPEPGYSFGLGTANALFLAPAKIDERNLNNCSVIVRISQWDFSFIFMGDAEIEIENELIASDFEIETTVIKIGHHGSRTSTSAAFLRAVNPKTAVISVGSGNTYGHPTSDVLNRLLGQNVELYRTDLHGNIIMSVVDGGITIIKSRT